MTSLSFCALNRFPTERCQEPRGRKLLENTSNEGLHLVKGILERGSHVLGNVWTDQLAQPDANDINAINSVLPGLPAQFRTATPQEVAQLPRIVDPQLLESTTVNFSRSLIRLAWMLQHVETLLPMAVGNTSGAKLSHSRGKRLPCVGTHASLQFACQPSYIPLSGGSKIP